MPDILHPDIPVTARIPSWIILLLVVFTGGYFMIGIGLYLSYWVFRRRPASKVFYVYLLCAVVDLLPLDRGPAIPNLWAALIVVAALAAFVAAPFELRHELQAYLETQGSHVEMSAGWTLLFGAAYINYCMSVVFSGESGRDDGETTISPSR